MTSEVCPDDACVLTVDEPGGPPVVLAFFAGLGGGKPTFEFQRTATAIRAHKVFVRDLSGLWYLNGVAGAGGSPEEHAAWLRAHCAQRGAKRLITIGNSAGGFAAILFGVLAGADQVLAFAPKVQLLDASDFHDPAKLSRLKDAIGGHRSYLDLRPLVLERGASTTIHIHYPGGDAVDARHAARFADLPNVRLWKYPWRRHTLVKVLQQRGMLKPLIENAIAGDPRRLRLLAMRARWAVRGHTLRETLAGRAPKPANDPAASD